MEDNFKVWKISNFFDNNFDYEFIEQKLTIKGLRLKFKYREVIYLIEFERYMSFRISDESNLLSYWDILPDNVQGYPFFRIEDSSYIKEFKILSKNFFTSNNIDTYKHYCIFFEDDCFEVITDYEPIIREDNRLE